MTIYALIPLFYFTVLLLLLFELLYYEICDGECIQCEIEKHDVSAQRIRARNAWPSKFLSGRA